ncbi:hypothetical protein ACWHLZ_45815 [Streptomyces chartreusis]
MERFEAAQIGTDVMVRNVIGYVGLTALASTAFGARTCWLPVMVYTFTAYLTAPRQSYGAPHTWAWPLQPGSEPAAWAIAGALFVVGMTACSWLGPRTSPYGE